MAGLLKTKRENLLLLLAAVVMLSVFLLDLFVPAGITISVLYLGVVLIGLWVHYKYYPYIAGAVTTLLAFAGYFLSSGIHAENISPWYYHLNLVLPVLVIWLGTFVIVMFKRYFEKLLQREAQFKVQFLNSNEGIIMTDQSGQILLANPSAEKMFGYEKDELITLNVEKLVPQNNRQKHKKYRKRFFHSPSSRTFGEDRDLWGQRKDGSVFPVEIGLSYCKSKSNGLVSIAFISDISERKQHDEDIKAANSKVKKYSENLKHSYQEQSNQLLQINQLNDGLEKMIKDRTDKLAKTVDELFQSKEELSRALEKEKEVNEIKSRFVSMASHEFRTPLSTILSSATLLGRYNDDEADKREKHITRIKSTVTNMTVMLDEFLNFNKLEEGMIAFNPEYIQLKEFITEITDEMQAMADNGKNIEYNHIGEDRKVWIDKSLLRNILHNLLSNALKYSYPEGLIHLTSYLKDEKMSLTVEDHGLGIPVEDQNYMFTRFYRGKNVANISGSGLGLNIVKKYVNMMNGSVEFTSEPGKGSKFFVHFENMQHVSGDN